MRSILFWSFFGQIIFNDVGYGEGIEFSKCVLRAIHKFVISPHDNATEIEYFIVKDTKTQLLAMLTTADGKVGSLFPKGIQSDLSPLAREKLRENVPWDSLNETEKFDFLRAAGRNLRRTSPSERIIPGLKVREKLKLNFEKETELLGTVYPPGVHEVETIGFIDPKVEIAGDSTSDKLRMFEFHFRTNLSPGDQSRYAAKFMKALGLPKRGQHNHLVFGIPKTVETSKRVVVAGQMTEFFRRANLAAEMIRIVAEKGGLSSKRMNGQVFFDTLDNYGLHRAADYFSTLFSDKPIRIDNDVKQALVGLHDSGKYDEPGVWGLQVRSISKIGRPGFHRELMDSLRWMGERQVWGISEERMKDWMRSRNLSESEALNDLGGRWHNKYWGDLVKEADPEIKAILDSPISSVLDFNWRLRRAADSDKLKRQVKMLLYNWSLDPLFFDQPEMIARIKAKQVEALKKIRMGRNMNEAVRVFLIESGIYENVLRNMYLEPVGLSNSGEP